MRKKLIFSLLAVSLVSAAVLVIPRAYATETGNTHTSIVSLLSQKLGIEETKVQSAFDDIQSERQKEMLRRFEERLTRYVADGTLTEAQKQAILAKHQEMVNEREQNRQEFENWADENGINLDELPFGIMGHGGKFGWRHHMM